MNDTVFSETRCQLFLIEISLVRLGRHVYLQLSKWVVPLPDRKRGTSLPPHAGTGIVSLPKKWMGGGGNCGPGRGTYPPSTCTYESTSSYGTPTESPFSGIRKKGGWSPVLSPWGYPPLPPLHKLSDHSPTPRSVNRMGATPLRSNAKKSGSLDVHDGTAAPGQENDEGGVVPCPRPGGVSTPPPAAPKEWLPPPISHSIGGVTTPQTDT